MMPVQPKAASSSVIVKLLNALCQLPGRQNACTGSVRGEPPRAFFSSRTVIPFCFSNTARCLTRLLTGTVISDDGAAKSCEQQRHS